MLQLSGDKVVMDDGLFQIGTRTMREKFEEKNEPVTTDHGKITAPWAGGATQRNAGTHEVERQRQV